MPAYNVDVRTKNVTKMTAHISSIVSMQMISILQVNNDTQHKTILHAYSTQWSLSQLVEYS